MSPAKTRTLVCMLLAAATVAVYFQTVHYDFVMYDDDTFVYQNPVVQAGLKAAGVRWAFGLHFANWHPLTWLSYLLDAQLFGMKAGGFHLVNVLLHTASVLLLFLALLRMTGRLWRSAFVAAVFALHPLHVESVAWVAERKDVLSTFFEMIALLLYAGYVERPTVKRYVAVVVVFACSVMSKPMVVTFPFILLLLDYWPLQRLKWPPKWPQVRRPVLEKVPLLAISIAASIATVVAQREYGAVKSLDYVPLLGRIANGTTAYVAYIRQALWPSKLGVLYPVTAPAADATFLAVLLLAAVTAGALIFARKRPYWFTGWLWYLVMLAPVIGLVQVGEQSHADRYMYVPLVGLTIGVVWAIADWLERRPAMARPAAVFAVAVLAIFAIGTWRQIGYWRDSQTLFEHTIAVTERNFVMRNNLGVILVNAGDQRGAMIQYRQAIAINPQYAEPKANLANIYLRAGQYDAARPLLQEAVTIKPGFRAAQVDLGVVEECTGHFQEAIAHLSEAVRLAPDDPEAHSNLCYSLEHAGRVEEAIAHCRTALQLRPNYPDAQFNLRNALAAQR